MSDSFFMRFCRVFFSSLFFLLSLAVWLFRSGREMSERRAEREREKVEMRRTNCIKVPTLWRKAEVKRKKILNYIVILGDFFVSSLCLALLQMAYDSPYGCVYVCVWNKFYFNAFKWLKYAQNQYDMIQRKFAKGERSKGIDYHKFVKLLLSKLLIKCERERVCVCASWIQCIIFLDLILNTLKLRKCSNWIFVEHCILLFLLLQCKSTVAIFASN